MSWKIALGLYFVLWWIVIFAILPFGVKSQAENESVVAGSDPGAPIAPLMLKKALWTSLITAIIVGLVHLALTYKLITL